MILIQLILIVSFLGLVVLFFKRQSSHQLSAWAKIFMVLFALIAVFVVLFPDSANSLAHSVGVTRGADLLLYMLTLSFLFVVLNQYVARKNEQRKMVILARKIALLEAELAEKDESK